MAPKKKPKRKPINAKTKATLQKKAANSKYTYGQLAAVYRRGQGAYLSSGSKSASMAAWAMEWEVNSFIKGGHSQDNDLKKKGGKKRASKKKRSRRKVKYEKGVPSKYLKNKKNSKTSVAREIKATAKAYKEGRYIDLKKYRNQELSVRGEK